MTPQAVTQTQLPLPHRRQGKVRDVYDAKLDDGRDVIILVATDRISAFDVVMPNGVPGKGIVLTQLSRFWFEMIERKLGDLSPHHLISTDATHIAGLSDAQKASLAGRVAVGRKTRVTPIECVVRGYLAGSGWAEYQQSGSVCGVALPAGLKQCDPLPEPIFTPATKAAEGHDENVSFERACEIAGESHMTTLRDLSLRIYTMARDYAAKRGVIIADTKFEFGMPLEPDTQVPILVDEVLTPDSSRFWPADDYMPGRDQQSFDKQYVRNYLQDLVDQGRWHKSPPGPTLPDHIVQGTLDKYREAYRLLVGEDITL